jgi:hypothetical protein
MSLKRIRIVLARDHDFPSGSQNHGYDFIAPLDSSGHLDAAEWRKERDRCRVRRFWAGEASEVGHLVHKRGGAWAFDYNPTSEEDDEKGFKFDRHSFVPGEYVSIKEHDGVRRTFFIKSVVDLD